MNTTNWTDLKICDSEGNALGHWQSNNSVLASLREFRDSGSMPNYFFEPLDGQDRDSEFCWMWGPVAHDIDWTGLDDAINALEADDCE